MHIVALCESEVTDFIREGLSFMYESIHYVIQQQRTSAKSQGMPLETVQPKLECSW